MKILTLTQKCSVWSADSSITGGQTRFVSEPVYVNAEQIESMIHAGNTILKMISGERIEVTESPQAIIDAISKTPTVALPPLPVLGANTEWYQGYASGADDMRNKCNLAIRAAGITVRGDR